MQQLPKGTKDVTFLCCSSPPGTPADFRPLSTRELSTGNQLDEEVPDCQKDVGNGGNNSGNDVDNGHEDTVDTSSDAADDGTHCA